MCDIIVSIKPRHLKNIIAHTKNHEFRSRVPKTKPRRLIVYTTLPIAEIRYILDIDEYVCFPTKIKEDGIGNDVFNLDTKGGKYAYPIKGITELSHPITLKDLKGGYGFTAPQGFTYLEKYSKLP